MKNFKNLWLNKREKLIQNPEKKTITSQADSELVEGFLSRVKTGNFELLVDQHEGMEGTNKGPRPSEYVLAALAACHEVTYRLYADVLDIPLEKVAVSVKGFSNACGFFDLGENVRAGFTRIEGQILVKSNASNEELDRLRQAVNKHCPILDDLREPVEVELKLKRIV